MPLPAPSPGLVISYSYLWHSEHLQGREEGMKDRPCAVILVTATVKGDQIVTVLPITHTPPRNPTSAVEIPELTKHRLGLDLDRSWVVLTEANRFVWPGPDLRPRKTGELQSAAYGMLPYRLADEIRLKFLALLKARRASGVDRTQ